MGPLFLQLFCRASATYIICLSVCLSVCLVRGGAHNVMEKLSRPEKETCVTPPPSITSWKLNVGVGQKIIFTSTWKETCVTSPHNIVEKLSRHEKETCVTPLPPHNVMEKLSVEKKCNSTRHTMPGAFSLSDADWRSFVTS